MANVVTNPTSDQTIGSFNLLPASGNTTQSLGTSAAPWLAQLYSLNTNIVFANDFPGANLGAQIAAAFTALGGNPGAVVVTSSGNITQALTIPEYCDLIGASREVALNLSGTGVNITLSSNSSVRNLTINSTSTATGVIYAAGVSDFVIEDVVFSGGNYHIYLYNNGNPCQNFTIARTVHQSLTIAGGIIAVNDSFNGTIDSPRVEFTSAYPSTPVVSSRLISLNSCAGCSIVNPLILPLDCTTQGNTAAISFHGSENCSLTGGILHGLLNCDGVLTENGSSLINISNTISYGNSSTAGSGSGTGVGDGFDIFNSSHIYLSNCQAWDNGTYSGTPAQGFEIFSCYDVVCTGCIALSNGIHGFQIAGSPGTKLIGCTAGYNSDNGANVVACTGTVSTVNSGSNTTVTWVSGNQFGPNWEPGTTIYINGVAETIVSVANTGSLTVSGNLGTHSSYSYSVGSYNTVIQGCTFEANGQGQSGAANENGILIGAATSAPDHSAALVTGNIAFDPQAAKTQQYGAYVTANGSRGVFVINMFENNKTGTISDAGGTSVQLYEDGSDPTISSVGELAAPVVAADEVIVYGATPTVSSGQVGFGNTTGFGNGTSGTSVTTTTKGTGSGPTTPQTVVGYLEINIGGTAHWVPYCT